MDIIKLLLGYGIRPTAGRTLVLKALTENDIPMSLLELEATLGTVDKSQISRALTLFMEKNILHKIEGPNGISKYELCHCNAKIHDDFHVHFYCKSCGKLTCLKNIAVPPTTLPDGYDGHESSFVISGICPDCQK